jgi:hypothetical protein
LVMMSGPEGVSSTARIVSVTQRRTMLDNRVLSFRKLETPGVGEVLGEVQGRLHQGHMKPLNYRHLKLFCSFSDIPCER